jgi:repressor LexA
VSDLPTKKQRELLEFVRGFITENGYGPSYREIMKGLGYKSVSTVAAHVNGLLSRGLLIKSSGARALELPLSTKNDTAAPYSNQSFLEAIDKKLTDSLLGDDDKLALERVKQLFS